MTPSVIRPDAVRGYINPLSQLVIGNPFRPGSLLDGQDPASRDFRLEMLDVTYEDRAGRLPHEPGYVAPEGPELSETELEARRQQERRRRAAYERALAAAGGSVRLEDLYAIADASRPLHEKVAA